MTTPVHLLTSSQFVHQFSTLVPSRCSQLASILPPVVLARAVDTELALACPACQVGPPDPLVPLLHTTRKVHEGNAAYGVQTDRHTDRRERLLPWSTTLPSGA